MKETKVIAHIDEGGHLTIPNELRQALSIKPDTPMEFFIDSERIVVKKRGASSLPKSDK